MHRRKVLHPNPPLRLRRKEGGTTPPLARAASRGRLGGGCFCFAPIGEKHPTPILPSPAAKRRGKDSSPCSRSEQGEVGRGLLHALLPSAKSTPPRPSLRLRRKGGGKTPPLARAA